MHQLNIYMESKEIRKKFLELQKLAWYDRPKTDATTNTIGYTHSTQQTGPSGALLLSQISGNDLSRQLSVDSLDSARDIARLNGELSDDSIEDENVPDRFGQSRDIGTDTRSTKRKTGITDSRRKERSRESTGRTRNQRNSGSGRRNNSHLSALYKYTTMNKNAPEEITAYDPNFPSNRDELINAAIETLMN